MWGNKQVPVPQPQGLTGWGTRRWLLASAGKRRKMWKVRTENGIQAFEAPAELEDWGFNRAAPAVNQESQLRVDELQE